jgi:hypothetical protein
VQQTSPQAVPTLSPSPIRKPDWESGGCDRLEDRGVVHVQRANRLLSTFEVLHSSLVILCCLECIERTQISPLPCLRIFFTRIQTVFARTELSDHCVSSATSSTTFNKDNPLVNS